MVFAGLETRPACSRHPGITEDVLAVIAEHRPDVPDAPVFRTSTLKPVPKDWTDFGLRALTSMSARRHVEHAPPLIFELVDERAARGFTKPFVGITTDGVARAGLRERRAEPKVSTVPITDAAMAFLGGLSPSQHSQATFAMDATEWRQWYDVHMNHFRHGLMLEDLEQPQRDAALAIVRATLSAGTSRRATSCASTSSSPSSPATTRRSASGRTSCRSSARPPPAATSRGAGRSTGTTCASTASCSTTGS